MQASPQQLPLLAMSSPPLSRRNRRHWRYPRKSRYFTVVGLQSFVKTAGDRLTVCEQELL